MEMINEIITELIAMEERHKEIAMQINSLITRILQNGD